MKHKLWSLLAMGACAMSVHAADVGVSISIGQPGFYGQLDIGDYPRPSLIYARPVLIRPAPPGVIVAPVYLHVPPGHAKNWKNYCGRYDACGRPVYFVQDNWYNTVYVPQYRRLHEAPRAVPRNDPRYEPGREARDRGPDKGHDNGMGKGR
ncbi:MAG: hypothetical protein QM756_29745 [Polyangiaceae bacterium]